jgi:ankyrin repeat protein
MFKKATYTLKALFNGEVSFKKRLIFSGCVRDGNTAAIIKFLEKHGNAVVNQKNSDGLTPLSEAAINGADDAIDLLLKAGADIYAVDNQGREAWILAAWSGQDDAVDHLRQKFAGATFASGTEKVLLKIKDAIIREREEHYFLCSGNDKINKANEECYKRQVEYDRASVQLEILQELKRANRRPWR